MAEKLNLDALIPRADLAIVNTDTRGKRKDTISAMDLQTDAFFFLNLNKPDFQRETTEWDIKKACDFVKSFLTGELIPAIILWQGQSGNIYVIDGAHRLSSLIAWINDDYGDGVITRKFFNNNITDEQKAIATKMRALIEKEIGAYRLFVNALKSPESYDSPTVQIARNLSSLAIQLQWVEGDVSSAERSFFNINQKASPINKTEMKLIENRKKPVGIAARAIMSSGFGHKYWSSFAANIQEEIERIASEIYEIMFLPKLQTPIKTTDVPMCGKHNNGALPIIYDFLEICIKNQHKYKDDEDGSSTVACLKQARKIARLINSNHESSLGLHPLLYFYSLNGSFRVAAFYAVTMLVKELDEENKKHLIVKYRESFEEIYQQSANIMQFIIRKARGAKKGIAPVKNFLIAILKTLEKGAAKSVVLEEIMKLAEFKDLPLASSFSFDDEEVDFSSSKKSEIFIRSSIPSINKCAICNGYLHTNSISIDHIQRKKDGGLASIDNGQLSHPYCNTGYKN